METNPRNGSPTIDESGRQNPIGREPGQNRYVGLSKMSKQRYNALLLLAWLVFTLAIGSMAYGIGVIGRHLARCP